MLLNSKVPNTRTVIEFQVTQHPEVNILAVKFNQKLLRE